MTVRAVLCQSFQCGEESGSRTTAAHQCACWCAPGPRASDSISTCRITDVQFWWLMCPPAPLITEPIHQRWLTFNTSETAELFTSQLHEDTHGYNIWRIEQQRHHHVQVWLHDWWWHHHYGCCHGPSVCSVCGDTWLILYLHLAPPAHVL